MLNTPQPGTNMTSVSNFSQSWKNFPFQHKGISSASKHQERCYLSLPSLWIFSPFFKAHILITGRKETRNSTFISWHTIQQGFLLVTCAQYFSFLLSCQRDHCHSFYKLSSERRKRAGGVYSSSLWSGYTESNTAQCSPTEVGNNTFIQSTIFISDLPRAEKTFLRPEICEFCKTMTKLDAKCSWIWEAVMGVTGIKVGHQQLDESEMDTCARKGTTKEFSKCQEVPLHNLTKLFLPALHHKSKPKPCFSDTSCHAGTDCHVSFFLKLLRSDNRKDLIHLTWLQQ